MKWVNRLIVAILQHLPKRFVWIFSKRYIAGEKLEDALKVTRDLNQQGIKASMDLLGEFLTRKEMIGGYKDEYIRLMEHSVREGLENSFSVKPTMFGLLLDEELCYQSLRELVSMAQSAGRFIRIDMEDSQCTNREIVLYRKLVREFPGHVGIVFQSYLKRTLQDLSALTDLNQGGHRVNVRLCKGIYNEPPEIAFKRKAEINRNFLAALDFMFGRHFFVAIATHDESLIEGSYRLIKKHKVTETEYEFQMLYGVTPELRRSVLEKGHAMRVYVPFGRDWFNYSTRRLRENPRMVSHIIKALFVRK